MSVPALCPLTLLRTAGLPLSILDGLAADFSAGEAALRLASAREQTTATELQAGFDAALAALPESPQRTAVYKARQLFFRSRRLDKAPLLNDLQAAMLAWEHARQAETEARQNLFAQYEQALAAGFRHVQQLAGDPEFQRGLLFASHDLLERIPAFQQTDLVRFSKKQRRTAFALTRYLTRAAIKTSPFSRFTTVSAGFANAETNDADPDERWMTGKTLVTPNVALLPLLYDVLLGEPSFYRALSATLNPCVVRAGDPVFRWLYFDGARESFQTLPATPAVVFVVQTLLDHQRRLPFGELLKHAGDALDAPPETVERFLLDLLDLGLLEWQWPERGFSPGWCGAFYQFLGFLPDPAPVIVEAAALLQWLRTAARTLPFQALAEARDTQRAAAAQVRVFFEKYGAADPGIPPEQLFYEDVEAPVDLPWPPAALQGLAGELAEAWREQPAHRQSRLKSSLWHFASTVYREGPPPDFLSFCEKYVRDGGFPQGAGSVALPRYDGQIGAVVQVFRENGQWRGVVNALFAGGGKLFARWLPLLPASARDSIHDWHLAATERRVVFPWQGWSNANFQPGWGTDQLAVPGGRPGNAARLLGQLYVEQGEQGLRLTDDKTGEPIEFVDLGLEAPETRPPAMQILAALGSPAVSLEALAPRSEGWTQGAAGQFRARQERGPLVLARAAWRLSLAGLRDGLPAEPAACFFALREKFGALGLPRRFFAHFPGEKPQYFDRDSPLLLLLFIQQMRRTEGVLLLVEMLPAPDQCVVEKEGALRASELIFEWRAL